MIVTKHFKKYLRLKRFRRGSYQFRKLMGLDSSMLKKEEMIVNQLFQSLSYTKRDKSIAERLVINLTEKEIALGKNYPKFVLEESKNHYKYFMQGSTENISVHINIENRKIPYWGKLEKLLRNSMFYYFIFDISFMITDKRTDYSFIIFGTEIGTWNDFAKIFIHERDNEEVMRKKTNKMFRKNLKAAEIAVDTCCKEMQEIKVEILT